MDREIDAWILALKGAVKAEDEDAINEAALNLLKGALNDLHRIADAVELIANKGFLTK